MGYIKTVMRCNNQRRRRDQVDLVCTGSERMTAFGRVPNASDVATISGPKKDRIIHNIYRMFQY